MGRGVVSVRHLRPANCVGPVVHRKNVGEYCLVDYSSCPVSDVCWIVDMDNGCVERDNCIIDTS